MPGLPHFPPKIKRVIYLFQSGAPSQLDLFDHKAALRDKKGMELPDSVRMGQRITTMTSGQKAFPVAPSIFKFAQHGQSGAWLSELLPHTAAIADDIAYNAHDIDDGLRAGLFDLDDIRLVPFAGALVAEIERAHPNLELPRAIHELSRRVITRFIEDVVAESRR